MIPRQIKGDRTYREWRELKIHESDPIVFYSRCSRRWRKIIPLRVAPNARICLNLVKDNPHIEQTTRQIALAEQFCFNRVTFHRRGMCEPRQLTRATEWSRIRLL